jgi:hypothetical protein
MNDAACDCGATAAKTPHAEWCITQRALKVGDQVGMLCGLPVIVTDRLPLLGYTDIVLLIPPHGDGK